MGEGWENLKIKNMQLISIQKYKDGVSVKHVKNRKVTVFKNKKANNVVIEFSKADGEKEEFNIPCAVNYIVKNKVQVTGIAISHLALLGLYACLHDYITRVEPELLK